MSKIDFVKILRKNIPHTTLIDEDSIISLMESCYEMGLKNSDLRVKQLQEAFESLLSHYTLYGKPDKATNLFVEEWEKKAGIY